MKVSIVTGLSGNEMYCLHQQGFTPGDMVIGNSVYSMGVLGSLGSTVQSLAGGEVTKITRLVHDGRQRAYERMMREARQRGGVGVTGITNELVWHGGNIEFLSVGSCLHREGGGSEKEEVEFSSAADGQELFCQIDAGFKPLKFVFGNVAYSVGVAGGIGGMFKSLARGEVTQYSEVFNQTRHLALERLIDEAKTVGANAVVGIKTSLLPMLGVQEMVMLGTASYHEGLPDEFKQTPLTSDLTCQEMWSVIRMGYMPIRLVLGVSVYALGFAGGFAAFFKSFKRGEIDELSTLIYDARENALVKVAKEAERYGADDVIGIKTFISQLGGGILEFFALGTAVKKMPGFKTRSEQLPPQAIITSQDTFVQTALGLGTTQDLNTRLGST